MLILFLENLKILMESTSLLATVREMSLHLSPEQGKEDIRDRSLFITWGWGGGGISRN